MSDHAESLLSQMLEEQRKTNELLMMLIQALADEGEDVEDQQPPCYLDGSPRV